MIFCRTFCKNVARIECATCHKRLYNACIWLKKAQLAKISSKCQIFTWVISRSSCLEGFFKGDVLEDFTGNPLYWSLLLQSKKRLQQHTRFPINFAEFSRTPPGGCLVFHYFKRGSSLGTVDK